MIANGGKELVKYLRECVGRSVCRYDGIERCFWCPASWYLLKRYWGIRTIDEGGTCFGHHLSPWRSASIHLCSLFVVHGAAWHKRRNCFYLEKNNYFYCFLSEYHRLCDDIWYEIPSNIHGHGIFLIASHVDTWKSTIRRKTAIYFMFMWRHFIDFTKSRHEHGRGLFECVGA